jgi:putative PEP-CTERM system integral membrane protein
MKTLLRWTPALLFWPWNVALICILWVGFVPEVLSFLVVDAVAGLARVDHVAGAAFLVVIPVLSVAHVVAHWAHFRKSPLELFVFFFGVELPLLAITSARLFGFHELSGAAELVYLAIIIGGVAAEARAFLGKRFPTGQFADGAMHVIFVVRALAGVYVGALLSSVTLPVLAILVLKTIEHPPTGNELLVAVVASPIIAVGAVTTVFVLLMPVLTPAAWIAAAVRSGKAVRAAWGTDDLFFTTAGPILAIAVAFVVLLPQPHAKVLARLAALPTTDAERKALVEDRDAIEAGLVNAYLGKHRYVDDDSVAMWSDIWSLDGMLAPRRDLDEANGVMRMVARPFLFEGRFGTDAHEARRLYRAFFGRELERDHAAEVRKALSASWSREARFAGFINEGQQRVRLESQDVSITDDGGSFTVEIHDTWMNQTTADEEVALFFELPESAAVTGLWLGPTEHKEDAFVYVTAPRGAAQQLYREEVRARRDPALIEQVGPRQYRLRVFPIPGRRAAPRRNLLESAWADTSAPRVHVWLQYQALPDEGGHAPMPLMRERRNGFWDDGTRRTENGVDSGAVADVVGGGWVQAKALTPHHAPQPLVARAGDACVTMTPSVAPAAPKLAGRRMDVVVDRSLAMADEREALKSALQTLRDSGAVVRVILGTSALRGEDAVVFGGGVNDIDVDSVVFFGAATAADLVRQYIALAGPSPGSTVIVLTTNANFDVATDEDLDLSALPGGVLPQTFLVHVGGAMPAGYDDGVMDAIRRSGGTASTSLDQALRTLSHVVWADGFTFAVGPCTGAVDGAAGRAAGGAVAARHRIVLADRGGQAPLEALDALHRMAVQGSVVTSYSSMIVLVNDVQRRRLVELSSQKDRFEREVEDDAKGAGADANTTARPQAEVERRPVTKEDAKDPGVVASSADGVDSVAVTDTNEPSDEALAPDLKPEAQAKSSAPATTTTTSPSLAFAPPSPLSQAEPPAANTQPLPQVSGVPEPEEWLLLILGGVAVGIAVWRRRRAFAGAFEGPSSC